MSQKELMGPIPQDTRLRDAQIRDLKTLIDSKATWRWLPFDVKEFIIRSVMYVKKIDSKELGKKAKELDTSTNPFAVAEKERFLSLEEQYKLSLKDHTANGYSDPDAATLAQTELRFHLLYRQVRIYVLKNLERSYGDGVSESYKNTKIGAAQEVVAQAFETIILPHEINNVRAPQSSEAQPDVEAKAALALAPLEPTAINAKN